jgi:hypothetical protein
VIDAVHLMDDIRAIPGMEDTFRDRRVDWDLRDRLKEATIVLCNIWQLRDPSVRSHKAECHFCQRSVACGPGETARCGACGRRSGDCACGAPVITAPVACVICWIRAGTPDLEGA